MKKTFVLSLLALCALSLNVVSCNDEELFVEETIVEETPEEVEETPEDTDDDDTSEEEDTTEEEDVVADPTQPCDFTLSNLAPNSTVIINCIMDLEGATVDIPAGVTIVYEGGDIINGTLNFLGDAEIGGELLNNTFTITGSTPQVKADYFEFDPKRWGIVEGKVSDEVARANRDILEATFFELHDLGIATVKIDAMDAYFKVDGIFNKTVPQDEAINVPSDFTLEMTDKTHLRVQPNSYKNTVLFSVFNVNNVTIDGGVFHGDRDEHDYSSGGTHEWGHLVLLKACSNVIFKNATLMDAGGDGIDINALGHAFDSHYKYCDNVLITGNKIIRARRNGLSITDGRNIIIEYNEFIDSGVPTAKSGGAAPQWALDIEAVHANGLKYEISEDIIIRNNIERGSEKGGFLIHRGDKVTIENNQMESKISFSETTYSIIRHNKFENPTKNANVAIYAGRKDDRGYGNERNHDNQVYGNIIQGFPKGIMLSDPGVDLHSNTIMNCKSGILIVNSRDSKIRNNTIESNVERSEGIGNHTSDYINNVKIYDNEINVENAPFRFTDVNQDNENAAFKLEIFSNTANSNPNGTTSFYIVRGLEFYDNVLTNNSIMLTKVSDSKFQNNLLNGYGIRIEKECSNISFIENSIVDGYCFADNNTDAVNIIKNDNVCN